ncbi:glycoside hydrolase family 3 N-terminal domain-containing protein [Geofilum rubicundum]|nr:glycoside hydrolase family 3 N-terminal domain-containing protein [Geofilum rubicundum]
MRILLIALAVGFFSTAAAQTDFKYKNPQLSAEERVADLLQHMTIQEKAGQLLSPFGWEMWVKVNGEVAPSEKFKGLVAEHHIGMLWGTYRADPWTEKTLETGLNPALAAETGNAIQKYVMEHTRLGIPIFLAEEAPHGHMAIGTTVFPTGIGLASTWSPQLIEEMGAVVAKEVSLQGGHIAYGPVLDLVRDPRWSRVEETYGEDPVLSGAMGAALVRGMGAGDLDREYSVISTLKHFLAYGSPEGGRNGGPAMVGTRDLHTNFLHPFREAVQAGALSVMTAYNSIDGIPCTSNDYLLTEVLRNQWGFDGFVVSDLFSIEGLRSNHYVAETIREASEMAIKAGVDVDLGGNAFRQLVDAVEAGSLDIAVLDTAVSRVLRLKFEMGLFENPYVEADKAQREVRTPEHIQLALKAAQSSIVLLENKNNLLPLNPKKMKKVAVIGPNAHNRYNMLGDYTAPQEASNIVTVLEGVQTKLGAKNVDYVRGCAIRDTSWNEIARAVEVAKKADVAIVVVGGSSARDFETSYMETGAAVTREDYVSDMDAGEGFDRATLELLGFQMKLLKAVEATGTPVVVVYIQGRPMDMNWAAQHAEALLTAWYPGQQGGQAIADVLFGDYNPAGRLPVTVVRSAGQLPLYYNRLAPVGHAYVDMPLTPLYSFGYGKSYTQFEYGDLTVNEVGSLRYEVSFDLKNVGSVDGEEVAQLYMRKQFASSVQPLKQLKHFERVFLKKGEVKRVTFTVSHEDLFIVDAQMRRVIEPGKFKLMIGASSDAIKLEAEIEVVK